MYIPRSLWCFFVSLEEQLRSRLEETTIGASASWLPKVPIQGLVSAFDRGLNRFLSAQEEVPVQEISRKFPENLQATFPKSDYGHPEPYIHESSQLAGSYHNYNENSTVPSPITHTRIPSSQMTSASPHYSPSMDGFSSNLFHEKVIQQRPPTTSRPSSSMSNEIPIEEMTLRKESQETLGGKWVEKQTEFHQEEATLYSQHYPNQDSNMKGNYHDMFFVERKPIKPVTHMSDLSYIPKETFSEVDTRTKTSDDRDDDTSGNGGGGILKMFGFLRKKKPQDSTSPKTGNQKADLGEENAFRYDPILKRWVNTKAPESDTTSIPSQPAPPPPSLPAAPSSYPVHSAPQQTSTPTANFASENPAYPTSRHVSQSSTEMTSTEFSGIPVESLAPSSHAGNVYSAHLSRRGRRVTGGSGTVGSSNRPPASSARSRYVDTLSQSQPANNPSTLTSKVAAFDPLHARQQPLASDSVPHSRSHQSTALPFVPSVNEMNSSSDVYDYYGSLSSTRTYNEKEASAYIHEEYQGAIQDSKLSTATYHHVDSHL